MPRKFAYDPVKIASESKRNKEIVLHEFKRALKGAKSCGTGFIVVRSGRNANPEIRCLLWYEVVGILREMGVIGPSGD